MGEEVNHFYRYIRPQRFSEKRIELTTLSHGGICLRFEELPEGDLFFTYSRCHKDDYFNKDVARVIADDRATVARSEHRVLLLLRGIPYSQSIEQLVPAVIVSCRGFKFENEQPLVQRYMQVEYSMLADALEELVSANEREARRCASWKAMTTDLWKTTYQLENK